MAKRKRKMTLFDVINSGQPIGIQVRQRAPSYLPTPELPVQKKLTKLFGRKKGRDPEQPLTAAEELEQLRRELGGGRSAPEQADETHADSAAEARASETRKPSEKRGWFARRTPSVARSASTNVASGSTDAADADVVDADVSSAATDFGQDAPEHDPTAAFFARPAVTSPAQRAAAIAREFDREPEGAPKPPRKPLGAVLNEQWAKLSPSIQTSRQKATTMAVAGWQRAKIATESLREINTRHFTTVATAAGAIIVLGGSFYLGKLLLQRPATDSALIGLDGINTEPRPDVMDIRANQPIANLSSDAADVSLQRGNTGPSTANPQSAAAFGGRNTELNYVIIQSFYSQAEAEAAVDVLAKYNIRSGVEKNLPGWSNSERDFYSVVSFDGFARMKDNDAYQSYLATITKISDRETGGTLPKRLDPRPYKFQRSE